MKKTIGVIIAGVVMLASAGMLWAVTYTLTAVVPAATGVNMTVNRVTLATDAWSAVTGTALGFSSLVFDNTLKIWKAPDYFAIDVANSGAGSPNVTVTYAEGSKPGTQTKGLGYKATATFKKVVYVSATVKPTESDITGHTAKALKDVVNENVTSAQTAGGWLRLYVGLSTGEVGKPGEPFTNADQPGVYTGTVTVTATTT